MVAPSGQSSAVIVEGVWCPGPQPPSAALVLQMVWEPGYADSAEGCRVPEGMKERLTATSKPGARGCSGVSQGLWGQH